MIRHIALFILGFAIGATWCEMTAPPSRPAAWVPYHAGHESGAVPPRPKPDPMRNVMVP